VRERECVCACVVENELDFLLLSTLPNDITCSLTFRMNSLQVVKEDDVLHLSTLPNFSNMLPPSDSERLIQMLTVPYLRIPLVLAFRVPDMFLTRTYLTCS
jgi:hypothetical protein